MQRAAEMTAKHMASEVCSIYLYFEDTQELVLKANVGLKPEAVGQVRLKIGEGLTGLALKEMRPICEREASRRPGYRYFPEIGEEPYESFLAVPILRGNIRIGVMVVQSAQTHYFTDEDINTLRAITSQLANTIETVKILLSLEERHPEPAKEKLEDISQLKFLKGRSGSSGIGSGLVAVMEDRKRCFAYDHCLECDRSYSMDDFYAAVKKTEETLERFQVEVEEKLADMASLIFTAQIMMLKDKGFIDAISGAIKSGVNPPAAIKTVVRDYVRKFQELDNPYLKEKAHDVEDVGIRLLECLVGEIAESRDLHERIVIAREIYPSDMLQISSLNVKGLVLLRGGITSHIAILARSLELPLVFVDDPRLLGLSREDRVLIDADNGNIYINPTEDVESSFARKLEGQDFELLSRLVEPQTFTKDGTRVKLQANINLLLDLRTALAFKAEGIGLYRTEFPFIVRSDFPTEEEQFVIYQKLVRTMPNQPITFRTLDIGGDKVISYYDYGKEKNPFLGMRSIRFSLRHKEVFRQQLRAILRAGEDADLRVMFPMISSVDEFVEARQEILDCVEELRRQGLGCHPNPRIGMMVELPSVMEIIDELAQEADFFSIGTNDFIQYMLAVDRTNETVAELYLPHHPSVLRALKKIVETASRHGKDVSVCGDMSYDERYLPFFLGIGVRCFSIDPHLIPRIQQTIRKIDLADACRTADDWVREHTIAGVFRRISERL